MVWQSIVFVGIIIGIPIVIAAILGGRGNKKEKSRAAAREKQA